jgi:hypothetical protein
MVKLTGGCHCRNITVEYETSIAPEEASPRACQCSFCRKHQSRAVSDNAGSLQLHVKNAADLNRYTFGMASCQFLICKTCGVYIAGFMPDPDDKNAFATLMVSALDDHKRYPPPSPTAYDAEDKDGRTARRRRVWTPATLTIEN